MNVHQQLCCIGRAIRYAGNGRDHERMNWGTACPNTATRTIMFGGIITYPVCDEHIADLVKRRPVNPPEDTE